MMGSRVAYGMAKRQQAPKWFAAVHPKTQTPLHATIVVTVIILFLALFFLLITLAKATSSIILVIFASVNLALWRVKKINPDWTGEGPRFPRWLPMVGFMVSLAVLLFQGWLLVSYGSG